MATIRAASGDGLLLAAGCAECCHPQRSERSGRTRGAQLHVVDMPFNERRLPALRRLSVSERLIRRRPERRTGCVLIGDGSVCLRAVGQTLGDRPRAVPLDVDAAERIRTSTRLPGLGPEPSASASSATAAESRKCCNTSVSRCPQSTYEPKQHCSTASVECQWTPSKRHPRRKRGASAFGTRLAVRMKKGRPDNRPNLIGPLRRRLQFIVTDGLQITIEVLPGSPTELLWPPRACMHARHAAVRYEPGLELAA